MVSDIKKYFNILALFSLLCFSFFYLETINLFIINKSDLMIELEKEKDYADTEAIDAVVMNDYVIPGVKGSKLDILKSYFETRKNKVVDDYFLIYDFIEPNISIKDFKNLYIQNGNPSVRQIALIINNNKTILNYALENSIKINKLSTYQEVKLDKNIEYINNDVEYFAENSYNIDNRICVISKKNEELCKKYGYFLIKPNILLTNNNFLKIKANLNSGQIILIDDEFSLNKFILLYREILYRDYNIVYLSHIISE